MSPRTRHFLRYQLPAIVWALVIFAASSIPASKLPRIVLKISDKIIHASVFLVFGLLVYRALEIRIQRSSFDWRRALISVCAVTAYGVLDELHQSFVPGRTTDIWDATADATGGLLSALILYLVYRRRKVETSP
jgi:VanZ family protein